MTIAKWERLCGERELISGGRSEEPFCERNVLPLGWRASHYHLGSWCLAAVSVACTARCVEVAGSAVGLGVADEGAYFSSARAKRVCG